MKMHNKNEFMNKDHYSLQGEKFIKGIWQVKS